MESGEILKSRRMASSVQRRFRQGFEHLIARVQRPGAALWHRVPGAGRSEKSLRRAAAGSSRYRRFRLQRRVQTVN